MARSLSCHDFSENVGPVFGVYFKMLPRIWVQPLDSQSHMHTRPVSVTPLALDTFEDQILTEPVA